jgi:hypothetical protein
MLTASQEADEESHDTDRRGAERRSPQRVRVGAEGGLVATVVMTAFRLPISRSLPPTDEFWRQYVRRDDDSATLPAIVLHLCYGIGAGVVYAALGPRVTGTSEARAELRGVVTAVAYSLVLSVFGLRVLLRGLLGEELDPDEALIFHLGHVVYGITLGAWLGSRGSS